MPNIYIYGLEKKKAVDIEKRISKTIKYDKKFLGIIIQPKVKKEKVIFCCEEKETKELKKNRTGDKPGILIVGDNLKDVKNLKKSLTELKLNIGIEIKVTAIDPGDCYPIGTLHGAVFLDL